MPHLVAAIVALAEAHRLLAYGLAFLMAGSEALPVFGAFVPGTATIIAFGALVPSGALQFWPLVVATTGGAIAGDGFSYWLGHHYKLRVAAIWPLRRHPGLIAQGEAFFAQHGGKAVVIARFTPGVRAVVPLVAGIVGMPILRFYAVNALSAVLWAPSHVIVGVLIGVSIAVLGAIADRLVALVLAVAILLGFAVWLTPCAVRWLTRLALRLLGPLHVWATGRDTWVRRQVLYLVDPARPELPGLLTLGAMLIGGLWLFFGALEDVVRGDPLVRANGAVFHLLQSLRVEAFDRIIVAVTELGDVAVTLAVASVAILWLAWNRAWRAASYSAAAVIGAAAFAVLLDLVLPQPQPGQFLVVWSAFVPSSHTTLSVALYGFLAVLVGREVGMRGRIAIALAAVLLVTAIAFSRLYLGAQWLSDIIAGVAFDLAWVALLGIAYLQRAPQHIRATGLAAFVGVALIAAGTVNIALSHDTDMERYAMRQTTRMMPLAFWQKDGWSELPARRIDLLGEYREPFTIQWAGSIDSLRAELEMHGWTAPVPWTLRSALEFLSPHASLGSLPVLPQLNNGRSEDLVMVRMDGPLAPGARVVLRLWRSDVILSNGAQSLPLWIGTAVTERVQHLASLVTVATEAHKEDPNVALRLLSEALPTVPIEHHRAIDAAGHHEPVLLGPP
ncbi:MAG TPA: VTT domain-containing protein [Stellaceae bacterium]|nr:VTT domain-containing protein [Stellaceae bacterium]